MAKKDNKILTIGISIAVAVIALIIIIVIATAGKGGLSDSYFVSDNTKYVLTLDGDEIASDDGETAPTKGYIVYFYEGDNVTDMKAYYKFETAEDAEKMQKYYQEHGAENYKSVTRDGQYVILTAKPSEYEGLTTSDIKEQIEFLEELKTMELDAGEDEDIEDEDYIIDTSDEGDEGYIEEETIVEE